MSERRIDEGMEKALCEQRRSYGWGLFDDPCGLDGCTCLTDERVTAEYRIRAFLARGEYRTRWHITVSIEPAEVDEETGEVVCAERVTAEAVDANHPSNVLHIEVTEHGIEVE